MKKYLEITKIKQLGNYSLLLTFNSEVDKIIDFKPFFNEKNSLFNILKDKNEFNKHRIDMAGGLAWDCGIDLAPDMLFKL